MKLSPELRKAQANMAPGEITATGFLGDDRRPLSDIIEADEEAMQALGLEFEETARLMRHLMDEGRKGLGEPTSVDTHWLVRVDESRGFLPSPFQDGIHRKINVTVRRTDRDITLVYTEMSIHLLEKQHFLQGKGSPFRLEPNVLRAALY